MCYIKATFYKFMLIKKSIIMKELKEVFASGDVPAMVRQAAVSIDAQKMLLDKGNEKALEAFVIYGHKFRKEFAEEFVESAPAELIKTYISVHILPEKAKVKLIARKDGALSQALIDSGQWSPFPFAGACFCSSKFVYDNIPDEI